MRVAYIVLEGIKETRRAHYVKERLSVISIAYSVGLKNVKESKQNTFLSKTRQVCDLIYIYIYINVSIYIFKSLSIYTCINEEQQQKIGYTECESNPLQVMRIVFIITILEKKIKDPFEATGHVKGGGRFLRLTTFVYICT